MLFLLGFSNVVIRCVSGLGMCLLDVLVGELVVWFRR